MRRFISKTMLFLGIFSLVLGVFTSFGTNVGYAEDLELIGRDLGLVVTPASTRLFDLSNLNPGGTKEAKVNIKNNYTSPFELFMRTERMSLAPGEGEPDMFDQLIITVYLGEEEIYTGPMMDYATSNISLGKFNPSTNKDLRAVVHLPGPETGNEFQGESVEVKWIFIAQADQLPPPGPGPGPDPDPTPDPDPDPTPTPAPTPTPEVPEEEPVEEVEIDEEIPEGTVEVQEVEEEIPEEVIIEEEVPEGQPAMPKTGGISSSIYYGIGTILVALGIGTGRKRKNK